MNELPSTAIGVFRQLSVSKTGIDVFCKQLVSSVQNGEVNPLELKAFLKTLEIIIERVDKETKENQLTEAGKYSESKFSAFGVEIEKSELGVKYDYLSCGDPVYEQCHAAVETAKARLDERAQFLKALHEPLTIVDETSGEVTRVRPPLKRSTSGLRFSIK